MNDQILFILGIVLENITNAACLNHAWNITVYLPELRKKYPDFIASEYLHWR